MSRICEYCGKEIPEGDKFCASCGTFPKREDDAPRGKLRVKFTVPKIIFIIIAVIALVGCVFLARDLNRDIYDGGGFESALDNMTALSNGRISKIKTMAPKEFWKTLEAKSGVKIDEYIEEQKALASETKEDAETEKKIPYSYEIVKNSRIKGDALKSLDAKLRILCGVDKELVSDAYLVDIIIKQGEESQSKTVCTVRIGEAWYPLDGGDFMYIPDLSQE